MKHPQWSHPIEAVHAARDAINFASNEQARIADATPGELVAYGSVLATLIQDLSQFAQVLTRQAAAYDAEELDEQKYRDEPIEKYYEALRNLVDLCDALRAGADGANRYWNAAQQMHNDLKPVPPEVQE